MSSSSDSESDENTKMLLASVDTNFYSDKMYKKKDPSAEELPVEVARTEKKLKSNRYIEDVEEIFKSDINVPESMKKYVGQKFSEMVSKQVEFVDLDPQCNGSSWKMRKIHKNPGVQLLKGAPILNLDKDPNPDLPEMSNKPLEVKKRVVEEDSVSELTKVLSAVVDPEILLEGSETKHWKRRQKPKMFEYKVKKGVAYSREPVTEWTKLRNKNNWTESKIKEFHEKLSNKS